MKIYFSHLLDQLLIKQKGIEIAQFNGSVKKLIELINESLPGFSSIALNDKNNNFLSSLQVFSNVVKENHNFYGGTELKLDSIIDSSKINTILFSSFNPENFGTLLHLTVSNTEEILDQKARDIFQKIFPDNGAAFKEIPYLRKGAKEPKRLSMNSMKNQPLMFIDKEFKKLPEYIPKYKNSEKTTRSYCANKDFSDFSLEYPINNLKNSSEIIEPNIPPTKILSPYLEKGIKRLFEINQNADLTLRKFQEDTLFLITQMFDYPNKTNCKDIKSIILSMPTGGGKTEAFLIPLLNYILFKKITVESKLPHHIPSVKAIIFYPTKALAVDQAERFVKILYEVNLSLKEFDQTITLGVFTGDTPFRFDKDRSFFQICPKCGSADFRAEETQNKLICNKCEAVIDFALIDSETILKSPPDILITNPDKINLSLIKSQERILFRSKIGAFIFDEVHQYQGIFGCHVAHLLRRIENAMGAKPVYIGLSATIGNAKELGQLLFNLNDEEIFYQNYLDFEERYLDTNNIEKVRYHYAVKSASGSAGGKFKAKTFTTGINLVNMINHAVKDPHFRKTVVFNNYRKDADKFAQFLSENEGLIFQNFVDSVYFKVFNEQQQELEKEEIQILKFCGWWGFLLKEAKMLSKGIIETGYHHGALNAELRIRNMNRFITTKPIDIGQSSVERPVDRIIATKTLELGVDIGDVTTVLNSSAPLSTSEYIQRVGRAGRRRDSLAITVLNPELPFDAHFYRNFENFIDPKKRVPEDVPILISNRFTFENHIYARILDHIANILWQEGVFYNLNLNSFQPGQKFQYFIENIQKTAEEIYNSNFDLQDFNKWMRIEHKTIFKDIGLPKQYKAEEIIEMIKEGLKKIQTATDLFHNEEQKMNASIDSIKSPISGLIPSLRSTTSDIIIRLSQDEDRIITESRSKAISQLIEGAFYSHGLNNFIIKEVSPNTPRAKDIHSELIDLIAQDKESLKFFHNKFPLLISEDPYRFFKDIAIKQFIEVPGKIETEYFPNKFICPKCGRTYSDYRKTFNSSLICQNPACKKSSEEVQQIKQIFLCTYPGGKENYYFFTKPDEVATIVEINKDTSIEENILFIIKKNENKPISILSLRKELNKELKELNSEGENRYYETSEVRDAVGRLEVQEVLSIDVKDEKACGIVIEPPIPCRCPNPSCPNVKGQIEKNYVDFRANLYLGLKWKCRLCKTSFNFHSVPVNPILRKVAFSPQLNKEEKIAKQAFSNPEFKKGNPPKALFFYRGGPCGNNLHTLQDIAIKNLPSYYADLKIYLKMEKHLTNPLLIGEKLEYYADEIQEIILTKDKVLSWFAGQKKRMGIQRYPVKISVPNILLGQYFPTHCLWIKIDELFLQNQVFNRCPAEYMNCVNCLYSHEKERRSFVSRDLSVEDIVLTSISSELYEICKECGHFVGINCNCGTDYSKEKVYSQKVRVILHSLKHILIHAAPRYTGVTTSEISGIIHPNDIKQPILAIIDPIEGGSGSILLFQKYFNEILALAKEMVDEICQPDSKTSLHLSNIVCRLFNQDLCPIVVKNLFDALWQTAK